MKIWIIDEEWPDYDYEIETLTKQFPGVEIKTSTYDIAGDFESFGQYADGILAQVYAELPAPVIERLQNCKGIAVYGGGYEKLDIEACRKKGIKATNIQGYCAEDVADYVIAAIYHGYKQIGPYSAHVQEAVNQGLWGATAATHIGHRLSEQSLLVLGLGGIGSVVARKAKAIGLNVLVFDEYADPGKIKDAGYEPVAWNDGFARADYISINLRGCEANFDRVGATEFDLMKPTAWLINTARGPIIKEAELIEAAKAGKIGGAVLDVICNEPPHGDNPIMHCPNIYVTPHVSYMSVESYKALKEYAVGNLIAMLTGKTPRDPIV